MTLVEAAFLAASGLIFYTFAGYPLLMAMLAALRPRPIARGEATPAVAIVVVVHNGAAMLAAKIATCLAQEYPADRLRLLVALDGSDDATLEAARSSGDARVGVMAFETRRGKAACVNDAVEACAEEIVVLTDVRQRLHPQAVRRLVENLADPAVGAVSGELAFETEGATDFGEAMDAYWRYEKWIRRNESAFDSCVGVTGALYAIRRECFERIPPETILDDVLIPMGVAMRGRRVAFESAALAYDHPSRDAAQERTRKIRTLAGNFQLLAMRPALLAPWRDRLAFQFWSHKALRLAAPAMMAVALAANAFLAGEAPFYAATLALQVAAYALAFAGRYVPGASRLPPARLASAFFSLNWFVVLGLWEFVSNPAAHLWAGAPAAAKETRAAP
jgi:biofilm PGA synthesis N-glycosyltransferase PgaC